MAEHYIRAGTNSPTTQGTAGWGDGQAAAALPATLIRGDTYYVASGTYPGYTFSSVAGTATITVKKATIADHGTGANWLNSYDNGPAVWQSGSGIWSFNLSNLIIDGVTGGGPGQWETGLGFKLIYSSVPTVGPDWHQITMGNVSNVTMQHVEIDGRWTTGFGQNFDVDADQLYALSGSTNFTMRYCYFHDNAEDWAQVQGTWTNWTIEYCRFKWAAHSSSSQHGDLIELDHGSSTGFVFRWNYVSHFQTTYVIGAHEAGSLTNYAIYGNIFSTGDCDNGQIDGLSGGGIVGPGVYYNNTVYNLNMTGSNNRPMYGSNIRAAGNICKNNLFYSTTSQNVEFDGSNVTHDFNAFRNSGTQSETNIQNLTTNPFVNPAGDNFALTADTNPGTNLGAPYNVDMFGTTRSTWTRGALQFGSGGGDITPPAAPTNLRFQ